jgi:NIMA (never in mitosis gene a)-related kinase
MKRVKISALDPRERENALNEVRILASLHNINIVAYKEAFYDEESKTLNIVLEFSDDGDLESKIQKNIKSRWSLNENDIWNYPIQIIQGLKYLHDNKIMHRDIKCANIFMNKNGVLKLGDLNVSKIVKMGLATTQTGTPYYASPEVWADKPYDYKSDIWSVGCVIYEVCTLKPPFRGTSLEQLSRNVRKGNR